MPVRQVSRVAGNGEVMISCGCCNDEIGLRVGVTRLATHFNNQPPPQHDRLANLKHTTVEAGPSV